MISGNPLLRCNPGPLVAVAHGDGPYENTRRTLQTLDLSPVRGKRVLLKPNAGRIARAESGVTTHPEVVAAAIDGFRTAGAEVTVGESPIVGVRVMDAFEATGIAAVAAVRDCPLIDLDRRRFVQLPIASGHAIHTLRVCADVIDCDYVISLPVMKTHMHTVATLAVKNMKGCLWRRSKTELHMLPPVDGSDAKSIDVAIADMSSVLRPHLALIDGTVGMEGLGPSAGQPRALNVVVASADAFAADAVAAELMGLSAERIPHLRIGAGRGYGVIDIAALRVTPDDWSQWTVPFALPPENLSIEFPNVTVWDCSSCSACQSTLLLFLKRHREQLFDYFPSDRKIDIAIGKGNPELPAGSLLIGNCTAHQRDQGVFVPGCPPVGSQILAALAGDAADEVSHKQPE